MNRRLDVKPLAQDRIDATFPIARAAVPGLTLERWRQFAAKSAAAGPATAPGIMVVENERRYIQGFCTYRLQRDIRHGTILAIDDLVAVDLVNGNAVAAALVDALEARARALGCGALRLHVAEEAQNRPNNPVLCEFLKRSGHSVDAIRLVKPVDLTLQ